MELAFRFDARSPLPQVPQDETGLRALAGNAMAVLRATVLLCGRDLTAVSG
jgi:hypothetical protein